MTLLIEPEAPPLKVDAHGTVRVGGTRVTLDTVIQLYLRGDTVAEIHEGFNSLSLADIHAVIAYYLRHRDAVDAYLRESEARAEEMRREMDRRSPWPEFKTRLLERRATRDAV